jgi:hypothetical protein
VSFLYLCNPHTNIRSMSIRIYQYDTMNGQHLSIPNYHVRTSNDTSAEEKNISVAPNSSHNTIEDTSTSRQLLHAEQKRGGESN